MHLAQIGRKNLMSRPSRWCVATAALAAALVLGPLCGSAAAQNITTNVPLEKLRGIPVIGSEGEQLCSVIGVVTSTSGQEVESFLANCGGDWLGGRQIERVPFRGAPLEYIDGTLALRIRFTKKELRQMLGYQTTEN